MSSKKRDYKKENEYKARPEQIHARVLRNKARREAIRAGLATKGDGTHVDHIVPLSKGGTNVKSNRRIVSASENSSFRRNSKGGLVSQTSKREAQARRKK